VVFEPPAEQSEGETMVERMLRADRRSFAVDVTSLSDPYGRPEFLNAETVNQILALPGSRLAFEANLELAKRRLSQSGSYCTMIIPSS
jgi:hypothetical protein